MKPEIRGRRHARVAMDTVVSIDIGGRQPPPDDEELIDRAFGWFLAVESACSRFDPASELMRLCATVGTTMRVSPILFEAVRFGIAVARLSGGAFDPTVGGLMEARGFNRNYRTGLRIASGLPAGSRPNYRDVEIDAANRTLTLHRPLVLDLGGVVKGLAIDLAARELASVGNYAIDAGGDIYVSGHNHDGSPWRVAVRHPRQPDATWCVLQPSNAAICTSGDYARPMTATAAQHHLLDPRTGRSPGELVSTTVVAPTAMLADALSTAVLVLGRERGLQLLNEHGLEGLTLDRKLEPRVTGGFGRLVAGLPA